MGDQRAVNDLWENGGPMSNINMHMYLSVPQEKEGDGIEPTRNWLPARVYALIGWQIGPLHDCATDNWNALIHITRMHLLYSAPLDNLGNKSCPQKLCKSSSPRWCK